MKLSEWAKSQGISYITAYRWFKKGTLPVEAHQTDSGTILICDDKEDNMKSLSKMVNGSSNDNALMSSMFDEMQRLANVFDHTYWPSVSRQSNYTHNRFKTVNEDQQYVVVGEVPGFTNDDISISVRNNILTISGNHNTDEKHDRYFTKGKSSFEMSYTLPNDANVDEISAEHKHGLLQVFIPKLTSPQIKTIPIKQLE